MLKLIVVLLSILLLDAIKANSNNKILKSLTAKCENSNTDSCTYSLGFFSNDPLMPYSGNYQIYVDSVNVNDGSVSVTYSSPQFVNFDVKVGSEISIEFTTLDGPQSFMLFKVFNKPDGAGQLVKDSRSRQWIVPNGCQESVCPLLLGRSQQWAPNLKAKLLVNGQVNATLDAIADLIQTYIAKDDVLSFEAITDPLTSPIPDELSVYMKMDNEIIFQWFSNAYPVPMIVISNGCLPPMPSPFGGLLIPLNQNQLLSAAESVKKSYSGTWYPKAMDD